MTQCDRQNFKEKHSFNFRKKNDARGQFLTLEEKTIVLLFYFFDALFCFISNIK